MNEMIATALIVSLLALIACALIALMFWQGKWLQLIAGRGEDIQNIDRPLKTAGDRYCIARRMSIVLLVGFLLILTLVLFEISKITGSTSLVSVFTLANNVAFLALIAAIIWFFLAQRPNRSEKNAEMQEPRVAARARSARLDHLPFCTILFVVVFLGVIGTIGVLFAQ